MHCTVSFYLQTIGPNLDNAAVVKSNFVVFGRQFKDWSKITSQNYILAKCFGII